MLYANQPTYIPPGVKHRLENIGEDTLYLIEVQSGNYLGEVILCASRMTTKEPSAPCPFADERR